MTKSKIKIRRVNQHDIKDLWVWRNEIYARKMFHNDKYVEWKDHQIWYNSILSDENILLFIGMFSDSLEKFGYIRFNKIKKENYNISISIAKNYRNQKLSKLLFGKSMTYFSNNETIFIAEILKINSKSISLFKSLGFQETKSFDKFNYYKATKRQIIENININAI